MNYETNFHRVLTEFYRKYNPEKLDEVDNILTMFSGRESLLVEQLCIKYSLPENEILSLESALSSGKRTPSSRTEDPQILHTHHEDSFDVSRLQETILKLQSMVSSTEEKYLQQSLLLTTALSRVSELESGLESSQTQQQREIDSLLIQTQSHSAVTSKLTEDMERIKKQRDNKHKQLLDSISLNHRLGAQIRFLAARSLESHLTSPSALIGHSCDNSESSVNLQSFCPLIDRVIEELAVELRANAGQDPRPQYLKAKDVIRRAHTQSHPPTAACQEGEEASDVRVLQASVEALLSSNIGCTAQLQQALKQNAALERQLAELQSSNDSITKRFTALTQELEQDAHRKQTLDLSSEVIRYETMLKLSAMREKERDKEIRSLKKENRQLRAEIEVLVSSKDIMSQQYAAGIKRAEDRAAEYLKEAWDRVLLEREDALATFNMLYESERELRTHAAEDIQRELHKVRQELEGCLKAERAAALQVSFLQHQLVDAANRISCQDESMAAMQTALAEAHGHIAKLEKDPQTLRSRSISDQSLQSHLTAESSRK